MKKVLRSEIKEGMRFSAPVFFDDGENMLVYRDSPIKKRDLNALDMWNISYVLTAGRILGKSEKIDDTTINELEELSDLDEVEDLSAEDELEDETVPNRERSSSGSPGFTPEQILKLPEVLESNALYNAYRTIVSEMDAIFSDIACRQVVQSRSIDKIVQQLISHIDTDSASMVGFILGGDIENMEQAKSAVNTAVLAVLICEHLLMPRHRLVQITTGALLHDVGMLKVPSQIVAKEGKLDDTELQSMRAHTMYGYKTIVNELMYSDEVGKAAAQHHERWDGEGYPGRLASSAIDLGARIISVADAFEAMVSPKSYRNALVGYDAMKNLLSDNARRFDPDIIKAMIQSFGIYPIGSIVLMNNSVIARVVQANPEAPLRPQIRILIDEFAQAYPKNSGEAIDLQENRSLFITRAINPREYRKN